MRDTECLDDDAAMTAKESWRYLRIGRTKFYEDVRSGKIPHKRLGDRIICYKAALRAFLTSGDEER